MFFLQSFALKSPNLQVDRENGDDQWDLGKRFLLEEKRPTQKPIQTMHGIPKGNSGAKKVI